MNIASLATCKELYELSGWKTDLAYDTTYADAWIRDISDFASHTREAQWVDMVPAYDLGYLLRKLLPEYGKITLTNDTGHNQWWCSDKDHHMVTADTPEDAACKLAIALIMAGVLKP